MLPPWPAPDGVSDASQWRAEATAARPRAPEPGRDFARGEMRRPHPPGRQPAPVVEPELKAKLLADWQVVKRARFHAAARLEQRHWLSLVTLTSVALYGGLVTVFVLIFKDSFSGHTRSIFDWVAAVASWLTLTFSLTEQIKNHSGKSRELHDCARQINDLRKRLQTSVIVAPQNLQPFVAEYDSIISSCDPNHEEIDYRISRLQGSSPVDGMSREAMSREARRLERYSTFRTYTPYIMMSLAPAIAGLLAWALVPIPDMSALRGPQ